MLQKQNGMDRCDLEEVLLADIQGPSGLLGSVLYPARVLHLLEVDTLPPLGLCWDLYGGAAEGDQDTEQCCSALLCQE
jgi:hypothetical protein